MKARTDQPGSRFSLLGSVGHRCRSSFGSTRVEAIANLREAVELYFEDAPATDFTLVSEAEVGQDLVHA